MKFGFEYDKGQLVLQIVPSKPSETDALNEAWMLVRKGKKLKMRFEDWEPGVPQLMLIVGEKVEEDDEDDEEE